MDVKEIDWVKIEDALIDSSLAYYPDDDKETRKNILIDDNTTALEVVAFIKGEIEAQE